MRRIPLRRHDGSIRAYALVNDADYAGLIELRWHFTNGYPATSMADPRREVFMHRLLMGEPPGMEVDHRDGNPLNNRRSNLRIVTPAQNKQNLLAHRDNPSGARGVSWAPHVGLWRGRVYHGGRTHCCGYHHTVGEAAAAASAKRAELMTHSEEWRHES